MEPYINHIDFTKIEQGSRPLRSDTIGKFRDFCIFGQLGWIPQIWTYQCEILNIGGTTEGPIRSAKLHNNPSNKSKKLKIPT